MAPSLHKVLLCHNALHGSTRPCSVTVASVVPQGPRVSQWTPCFHVSPQCHSGPLALWCHVVHSVIMVLSIPQGPAVSQWPLAPPGPCSVTIITESPRLEKTFESIKSNLRPNTTFSLRPWHSVPHPVFPETLPWTVTHSPISLGSPFQCPITLFMKNIS